MAVCGRRVAYSGTSPLGVFGYAGCVDMGYAHSDKLVLCGLGKR